MFISPASRITASLSLAGFTKETQTFCQEQGIGTAEQIAYAYREGMG